MTWGPTNATIGGGSSANFDLAKVTAYTPGHDAYTAITQIIVTGFNVFSRCNGTFTATSATSTKTGIERIYTNGSVYLQYVTREWEGAYWIFADTITTDFWSQICCRSVSDGGDVPTGSESWYGYNSGDEETANLEATTTSFPAVLESTTVAKVTAYNASADYFDAETSTSSITAYQVQPVVTGIYCRIGTELIGNMIRKLPNPFAWVQTDEETCLLGECATADQVLIQRGSYKIHKNNSDFALVASIFNDVDTYEYNAWGNVLLVSLTEDGAKKYRTHDDSREGHVFEVTSMVYKGVTYYYTADPTDYSINSDGYPQKAYANMAKIGVQKLVKKMIDEWKYGTAKRYRYNAGN